MQRDIEGARRGSINESFAHSIKGGSANRLNANAVGINVHSGTVSALVNSSPVSRPISTGKRPVFINTAPPPPKPLRPPRPAGWTPADDEVGLGTGLGLGAEAEAAGTGARPQSERQRGPDWAMGRATEEEVPAWLKQEDTEARAEEEKEEDRAPASLNPFGDRPSEQEEDAPPPPSSPPPLYLSPPKPTRLRPSEDSQAGVGAGAGAGAAPGQEREAEPTEDGGLDARGQRREEQQLSEEGR